MAVSRSLLERLCREILRARDVTLACRRHKAASVTETQRDVTRESTSSRSARAARRAANLSTASSPLVAEKSTPEVASSSCPVQSDDKASSDTKDGSGARTTTPPHLAFDTARPFEEMPGPRSFPLIGTMWMYLPGGPQYRLTFEEKLSWMVNKFGPIIRERIVPSFHMVHVFEPRDLEAVYRMEGPRPTRDAFRMLTMYNQKHSDGIQGLLTSQGESWYRLRSRAQVKMLKPKSAGAYFDAHMEVAEDLVSLVPGLQDQDGVVHDFMPYIYKFAMEGIGSVCFNRRIGAMDEHVDEESDTFRFIKAVGEVLEVTQGEHNTLFMSEKSKDFKKLVAAQSFIKQLSLEEVNRSLEMFGKMDGDADGESGDLIPYLMTKTNLREAEVLALITEFFFAGVDTTSHLLGFALYAMAANPEVQERLRAEVDRHCSGSDVITPQTLGRLSYLKAFTKETFRMFPVSPGNGRTLDTDIVLSGYHVPAGTLCALHHDWTGKYSPHVHEAERFLPERWLRGNTGPEADVHPFVLMPFGFGPRSCVGRRFAEQEYTLAVIKILQKYRLEWALDRPLVYEMCIVNKPATPLKFRFIPRE